ncbi:CLUMA_CG020173, isoform A [Clunio marinus]|uniref:CLUMA_CG020173, isoform A n=1 Tax=Clunio marinus TaxID=568069 RepID=A0A1J1J6T4_9DIPT|nr:CLUMA_CG020173, isoform A [Clunio marinus]
MMHLKEGKRLVNESLAVFLLLFVACSYEGVDLIAGSPSVTHDDLFGKRKIGTSGLSAVL